MSDLILPGTIPGLLRRGSPCFIGWSADREPATISQVVGTSAAEVTTVNNDPRKRKSYGYTQRSLYLDLGDATGRAHAAWWLMGLSYGYMYPLRAIGFAGTDAVALYGAPQDAGWASCRVVGHPVCTVVPALADLDPNNPQLLPDGSRWVDAEALRRVVLHVAGVDRG